MRPNKLGCIADPGESVDAYTCAVVVYEFNYFNTGCSHACQEMSLVERGSKAEAETVI